jgi:hypothetical protein
MAMIPSNKFADKVGFRQTHLHALSSVSAANITAKKNISTASIRYTSESATGPTTVTLDPSGATGGSYTTLTAALAALSSGQGSEGVVEIATGQTYTLEAEIDVSAVLNKFGKLIVRGASYTTLASDTIASTAYISGDLGWQEVTGTVGGYTATELAGKVLYDTTKGRYFGVYENTTGLITVITGGGFNYPSIYWVVYGEETTTLDAFATQLLVGSSIEVIEPTSGVTAAGHVEIIGGNDNVVFERLTVTVNDLSRINSDARMSFLGCSLDTNQSLETSALSHNFTMSGCVVDSSGFFTTRTDVDDVVRVFNSYLSGVTIQLGGSVTAVGMYLENGGIGSEGVANVNVAQSRFERNNSDTGSSMFQAAYGASASAIQCEFVRQDLATTVRNNVNCQSGSLMTLRDCTFIGCGMVHSISRVYAARLSFDANGLTVSNDYAIQLRGVDLGLVGPITTDGFTSGIHASGSTVRTDTSNGLSIDNSVSHGIHLINSDMRNGKFSGAGNGGYGLYLEDGSHFSRADQDASTVTGTSGDVRLGANGTKTWAEITTKSAVADNNDYATVGTENCSALH